MAFQAKKNYELEESESESESEVAQSCLTLCYPMDGSLSGSSVHGIFQARVLEWVAISSPGNLPNPGIEPRSVTLEAGVNTSSTDKVHNDKESSQWEVQRVLSWEGHIPR